MKNVLKKVLQRLKSPVVWSGLAVQIGIIVSIWHPDVADHIKTVIVAIGEIYTLFAMTNNPSDSENF